LTTTHNFGIILLVSLRGALPAHFGALHELFWGEGSGWGVWRPLLAAPKPALLSHALRLMGAQSHCVNALLGFFLFIIRF